MAHAKVALPPPSQLLRHMQPPHVQLVRKDGRDVSTLYGRGEGGGLEYLRLLNLELGLFVRRLAVALQLRLLRDVSG
jgi:hypothetical protein